MSAIIMTNDIIELKNGTRYSGPTIKNRIRDEGWVTMNTGRHVEKFDLKDIRHHYTPQGGMRPGQPERSVVRDGKIVTPIWE